MEKCNGQGLNEETREMLISKCYVISFEGFFYTVKHFSIAKCQTELNPNAKIAWILIFSHFGIFAWETLLNSSAVSYCKMVCGTIRVQIMIKFIWMKRVAVVSTIQVGIKTAIFTNALWLG